MINLLVLITELWVSLTTLFFCWNKKYLYNDAVLDIENLKPVFDKSVTNNCTHTKL